MATGLNNGSIQVYDMKNDKKPSKVEAHKKQIRDICFTADNTRIISVADDYAISVFDIISNDKFCYFHFYLCIINEQDIETRVCWWHASSQL